MRTLKAVLFAAAFCLLASVAAAEGVPDAIAIPDAPPSTPELDAARGIISNGIERYRELRGYHARFEKDEIEADGKLRKERSFLKFEKPFAIYMVWSEGERKGTQIVYAKDHYDDKMIVQLPGMIFNFVGPVTVATDDPRVAKDQKHSIKKAGIGFFIEDLWSDFQRLTLTGAIAVRGIEKGVVVAGEEGTLVDLELRDPTEKYPRKAVVFSDVTGLPLEIRLYQNGKIIETFRYLDVLTDPAVDHPTFQRMATPELFKKYVDAAKPDASSQNS